MKIVLLSVGKTTHEYIKHELLSYSQRLYHQMIRLFFIEQLYRVFTIISNEKYHHQ